MSLDFYLEVTKPTTVYSGNMTHNIIPMWQKAGCYDALYNSEGLKAEDIIVFLFRAITDMELKPDEYKKLNPKNGWGDYESALDYLKEVYQACNANLDAIIGVSK
jgi:hypothetical protein